jgi:competence protein ComEC
MGSLVA